MRLKIAYPVHGELRGHPPARRQAAMKSMKRGRRQWYHHGTAGISCPGHPLGSLEWLAIEFSVGTSVFRHLKDIVPLWYRIAPAL